MRAEPGESLLLEALREPEALVSRSLADWDELFRSARRAGVLSRLALLIEDAAIEAELAPQVRERLAAARPVAAQHERIIRWEVGRIREALGRLGVKIVLLKGAAYVMAGLPAGRGRLVSDVDVLVPRAELDDVERALLAAGWSPIKLDPYDQRYYRRWSHELPPLRHERRRSVVDVHHTILPVTARLRPDPRALLEAAVRLDGLRLWVLAPVDMVLHSATHLFQDGDLAGGIRDLVDLDALLRHFGATHRGFWERLVPRAQQVDLTRPLFYALRFAPRMLGTPVPAEIVAAAAVGRPRWPVPRVMDDLAARALLPGGAADQGSGSELARLLLYVRSHWLRMPPWLLTRHLTRKAWRRWFGSGEE